MAQQQFTNQLKREKVWECENMLEDFLENYFKIEKAYRRFFHKEAEQYQLSPNEIDVILFLHRNGAKADTSSDIAQFEGVSKGLIARSVDNLEKKGYLQLIRDEEDRRVIHLHLTDTCDEIVREIAKKKKLFLQCMQRDIPKEQIEVTEQTIAQFIENVLD